MRLHPTESPPTLSAILIRTAFGWKTSNDHWEDTAVWWDDTLEMWRELADPQTAGALDMAFVITTVPEPSVFILAGFGLLALLRRRK